MNECFDFLIFLAKKNIQLSVFGKGEIYASSALKIVPENIYAKCLMAYALFLNQKPDEAIEIISDITENDENIHYIRARASILISDVENSSIHLQKYIEARYNESN